MSYLSARAGVVVTPVGAIMHRDRSAPTDVGGHLNSHSAHAADRCDTATYVTYQRATEFAVYHIKRNLGRNRIRNFRECAKKRWEAVETANASQHLGAPG